MFNTDQYEKIEAPKDQSSFYEVINSALFSIHATYIFEYDLFDAN